MEAKRPGQRGERILVVDDEANAREALGELLRDEGYQVDTAADGLEALPKLGTFQPHLVLSDVRMPRMDGVALARAARARQHPPLVLLMSAYPPEPVTGVPYFGKPIDIDRLLEVLERIFVERAV